MSSQVFVRVLFPLVTLLSVACGHSSRTSPDAKNPADAGVNGNVTVDSEGTRTWLHCTSQGKDFKLIYLREDLETRRVYFDIYDAGSTSLSLILFNGISPLWVEFPADGSRLVSALHDITANTLHGSTIQVKAGANILTLNSKGSGQFNLPGYAEHLTITCNEDGLSKDSFVNRDVDQAGVSHSAYQLSWNPSSAVFDKDSVDKVGSITMQGMEAGYQPLSLTEITLGLGLSADVQLLDLPIHLSVDANHDGFFGVGDTLDIMENHAADLNLPGLAGQPVVVTLKKLEPFAGTQRVSFEASWSWMNRAVAPASAW